MYTTSILIKILRKSVFEDSKYLINDKCVRAYPDLTCKPAVCCNKSLYMYMYTYVCIQR